MALEKSSNKFTLKELKKRVHCSESGALTTKTMYSVHGGSSATEGERSLGSKLGHLGDWCLSRELQPQNLRASNCLYSLLLGQSRMVPTPMFHFWFLQPSRRTDPGAWRVVKMRSTGKKGAEPQDGRDALAERRRPTPLASAQWERRVKELHINSW